MALIDGMDLKGKFERGQGYELITKESEVAWPDEDRELPDLTALKIVTQDKAMAISWIQSQGWVLQWQREERLYLYKVPTRYWDGTNVPRSALGMPVVYEAVESILPQFMSAIFSDDPPFMLAPRPKTSMDAARANQHILGWQLEEANVRQETKLGLKYMLLHGTGIWTYGWCREVRKREIYKRATPTEYKSLPNDGGLVKIKGSKEIEKIPYEEVINKPYFEHRNIRYVLTDPALRSSDIRKGRFVADIQYPSIEDLDALRDYEGYRIPSRDQLLSMMFDSKEIPSQNPLESPALNLFQEFNAKPRNEISTFDPLHQPLEMVTYTTKDRVIVVLQGKLVIRNEKNPFGEINYLSCAMSEVLGYFYGIGIANVVGNEQRLQQGIINGYVDDFSLNLNGMFTRVRGSNVLAQQLKMKPGGVIDTDNPEGVGILPRQPLLTGDVMQLLASSDQRVARRTAASEISVSGAMPTKNSSITRTATGVNSLSSGTGTRLQSIVESFSDQVFVPMLKAFHQMNVLFLDPEQIEKILTDELGEAYNGDTIDIINGDYDFRMLAASKLQAKSSMAQTLPLLYQFLLTAPVLDNLAQNGMKVNVGEMVKMSFDVSGWPNYQNVIVPMTDEDKQKLEANSPAAQQQAQLQAQQQKQAGDAQTKSALLTQENDDETGREVIKELLRQKKEAAVGL